MRKVLLWPAGDNELVGERWAIFSIPWNKKGSKTRFSGRKRETCMRKCTSSMYVSGSRFFHPQKSFILKNIFHDFHLLIYIHRKACHIWDLVTSQASVWFILLARTTGVRTTILKSYYRRRNLPGWRSRYYFEKLLPAEKLARLAE